MTRIIPVLLFATLLCMAAELTAQDLGAGVTLHGFGGWVYGRTNRNNYLNGLPEGDYRHSSMALNLTARVDDRLTIRAQSDLTDDDDGTHVELDFAFADYHFSDHLSVRIGKIKHPFGISTEVFDVGTLRPFLDLPQGLYGPVGFAGESFKGVGLSGLLGDGDWGVEYDLYGGGNALAKQHTVEAFYGGSSLENAADESEIQSTRDVVGARLVVRLPITGLRIGTSSYTGILDEPAANRRTVVAAQLEYRSNAFSIESEVAHEDQVHDERATGGYVQAAYRFTERWQAAAQYDHLVNRFAGVSAATVPSLQLHREGALALNFWLSRSLVIKSEVHLIHGNRFALPHAATLVETIDAGQLRTTTRLFQFGAQFSY